MFLKLKLELCTFFLHLTLIVFHAVILLLALMHYVNTKINIVRLKYNIGNSQLQKILK